MSKLAEEKKSYFDKWKGAKALSGLSYPKLSDILLSGLGIFTTLTALAYLTFEAKFLFMIAPHSATAFLIFAAPTAPLAQPRNVVGGYILSALIGMACSVWLGLSFWSLGLACSAATAVMMATKTMHPPAACIAIFPALTANRDWVWVLYPTGVGTVILVIVGLLYNNLIKNRTYPAFWW